MITDDELYYFWGSRSLNKGRYKCSTDLWNKERKKLQNATKEEVIIYAKNNLRPILPDEQEFIKRKDWLPLDTLVGENKEILDNKIWDKTQKYIFENFKPKSKILLYQRCSSQKPYIDNSNYKFTKRRCYQGYCDLVVASLDIVPIDFTVYYPFRQYDWNDVFETPELTEYAIERKFKRTVAFIDHFKYNKIIIFAPAFENDTYYKIIYNKLKKHYGNNIQIEFVMNDETTAKCIESMSGHKGLAKVRYSNLKVTQERIDELLGINKPKPVNLFL